MKEKDPFFLDENFRDHRQIQRQIQTGFCEEQQRREKRDEKRRMLSLLRSLKRLLQCFSPINSKKSLFPFWRKKTKKKEKKNNNFTFLFSHQTGLFCTNLRALLIKNTTKFLQTRVINNKLKHKYGNFNFKRRPRRVGFLVRVSYVFTFFISYARFCWIFFLLFIQSY